jgi:hypothetical protein
LYIKCEYKAVLNGQCDAKRQTPNAERRTPSVKKIDESIPQPIVAMPLSVSGNV